MLIVEDESIVAHDIQHTLEAFGYKPLPKGKLEMRTAVRGVFDAGGLQGVLHLLADDRAVGGAMESELLRGACWVGPIRETEAAQ